MGAGFILIIGVILLWLLVTGKAKTIWGTFTA